jgi:ParB family transcriptional regulator, chromosome partitioning protein
MSKTRPALGKGLSALLPGAASNVASDDEKLSGIELAAIPTPATRIPERKAEEKGPYLAMVEIARVAPNPLQPRKDFTPEGLTELTESIRAHGVIQPVTVRRAANDRFELISGERRMRASIEAGLTHVPAYVIEADTDRKMLELAIVENVQREQFNPVEEAEAYQRLIEDCGLTQEDVAERISKDRTTVTNSIRLLRLPEPIKDSLRAGEITTGHAKALLSVDDRDKMLALWQQAVKEHLSVRKLEELARIVTGKNDEAAHPQTKRSAKGRVTEREEFSVPGIRDLEMTMQRTLGTQVRVRMKPDHTGEVAIEFYTLEDLERLQELIATIRND